MTEAYLCFKKWLWKQKLLVLVHNELFRVLWPKYCSSISFPSLLTIRFSKTRFLTELLRATDARISRLCRASWLSFLNFKVILPLWESPFQNLLKPTIHNHWRYYKVFLYFYSTWDKMKIRLTLLCWSCKLGWVLRNKRVLTSFDWFIFIFIFGWMAGGNDGELWI